MQDTQYGDSAAAKTLFAIVQEQPKVGSVNRKVSAFLSDYSHTAAQLEAIHDPHTVIRLQKLWMHTMDNRASEMFGVNSLSTHLRNVLKVRYRAFERRARARIKAVKQLESKKHETPSLGSSSDPFRHSTYWVPE